MIISKRYKFVFISTTKAATNTMYTVLKEHYGGKQVRGEKTRWSSGWHCNIIPDLPVLNSSGDASKIKMSSESKQKIFNWDKPTFERFNYEP